MLKHIPEHFHSSGAKGLLISQDTLQKESAQLFLQEIKVAQTRIICEKDHSEDAAVSPRFSELQIFLLLLALWKQWIADGSYQK